MLEQASSDGWVRVAFGDVVGLSRERSSDPVADGFQRYVGLDHIEPGELTLRRWGNLSEGTTFTTVFRPGQVLFGKRRAYQRKVAVADFEGVCSGDIYVLEAKREYLLPELLPFICQTEGFFEHAVGTSAGSLSPRTNWANLASYEFWLPPLQEQRRIASVLLSFHIASEGQSRARAAADRVRRAVLLDTFRKDRGSGDVFPAHWTVMKAADAGSVQLGQQRHPKFASGTNIRPYLRVANVLDGWIDFADIEEMHFPETELDKFELRPGDILLNEGQSTELVGRSAIYRGQIPGCCFQKTLLRFRCGPELLPEFVHGYFQHLLYTGQFARAVVQTTSMAHLTAVRFKEFAIPVPPLQEQQKFCALLAGLRAGADLMSGRAVGYNALSQVLIQDLIEKPAIVQ